ncbi:C-Jun-amino-terminal kinase-interacting protein 4 isoform X5 [Nilaparvata lugens]|uniref:C-Jun-amino-terminal kinase-interacting protein 4 isoform X5 n=1 Tax=Nilaparvata lugens TaxID=108931 RepID=UPI00193DB55B|nr:C-Jun-amino-terminal kinase-interacting protein 4 isoform X5 [Nilaparvata lugens]
MIEMEQEAVYGTHEDSHVVMSEKVQSLAGSIYQEFEKMIAKYDEDVVKDLMPLVVNVLECLDLSYTENQEHEVELELLREDNEQLVTQYEREKQLRKNSEQKFLEVEDATEDERKELTGKIESLESIVRMLELKAKNSSDHVYRLEEKEQDMKKEYARLHERYTELFKTHMDYLERTKILMGSDRMEVSGKPRFSMNISHLNSRSSGPVSFGFQSLEAGPIKTGSGSPGTEYAPIPASPPDSHHSITSLQNELQPSEQQTEDDDPSLREPSEKGWSETLGTVSKDNSPDQDISEDSSAPVGPPPPPAVTTPVGKSHTKREQRIGNTLYQELSFQDAEALGEMDEGADITACAFPLIPISDSESEPDARNNGMGKEVENLIMENNELLATKNALNIVKDDLIIKVDELTSEQEIMREELKSLLLVKGRLKQKVSELEEELKKVKEEADKLAKASKSDDEEDVPMAQRKRFTRVEMARVLMERNQYKERFMELQEAVRWTEMIRAHRNDPNIDKKQSVWKFFSSLFRSGERESMSVGGHGRKPVPYGGGGGANMKYNAPTHHVSPALDTMRKRSMNERKRGLDYIDSEDRCSEKVAARRATERKEQYRQVRAHVRKEDGRMHAYGWSLPAKNPAASASASASTSAAVTSPRSLAPLQSGSSTAQVPVPVPVYCRPLTEKEPGMKIWCATGVNLAGGRTKDGGSIVGASVFYSNPSVSNLEKSEKVEGEPTNPVQDLDDELKDSEREREERKQQLSSLVWICTSTHQVSRVTIIDANNPADILEAFSVCQNHLLCIASVPGAVLSDYLSEDNIATNTESPIPVSVEEATKEEEKKEEKKEEQGGEESSDDPIIGRITFVSCATGSEDTAGLPPAPPPTSGSANPIENEFNHDASQQLQSEVGESSSSPGPQRRLLKDFKEGILKDGVSTAPTDNELAYEELEKMSSVLPTVWLGSQNGSVYVHSAVSQWRRCLHSIKLKDSVLSIVHVSGRVLCALANGTVAVFRRGPDGQWDLSRYHVVDLGPPINSIRCLIAVHSKVWCGYKNRIHVLDPKTLAVQKSFDAHPRKESQVRQMAWIGDGVWVSIRLDSTLRLYHAHTYQHLQDVDIEPYVSKMLGTGKLGFSFVRITALMISLNRLWIGTGNGVIISVPLSDDPNGIVGANRVPAPVVRVFADSVTSQLTPSTFTPYCSMAQAQLSFHGHRDAVKFFVAVPGSGGSSAATSQPTALPTLENDSDPDKPIWMLVLSGGEGYIDFRMGAGEDNDDELGEDHQNVAAALGRGERSHLIVWQVTMPAHAQI